MFGSAGAPVEPPPSSFDFGQGYHARNYNSKPWTRVDYDHTVEPEPSIEVPAGRYLVRTRIGELIVSQNMLNAKALREFLASLRATFAPLRAADFMEIGIAVFLPLDFGEGRSGTIEIIPEAAIARAKLDVSTETSMEFLQRRRAGMLRRQAIKKMVGEAFETGII
jgi:hypothetical protein